MAEDAYPAEYFQRWYGSRSPDYYAPILAQVVSHGIPGRLLDLGAGTGLLAELAQRWGIDTVALEASEDAVQQALARVPDLDIRQFDLASQLPFEDCSVADVVLNQVIEHLDVRTMETLIVECCRVLVVGGRIFVYSPSRRNRVERDADPTHVRLLLPSELDRTLERAGFRVLLRPNAGMWPTPRSHVVTGLSRLAFRLIPHGWVGAHDLLSASANAIGVKVDRRP